MDVHWFDKKIAARYESRRKFAPLIRQPNGKPLDPSALNRVFLGERLLQIHEARQIAELLGESPVEVLIRAGALTAAEVKAWTKALRQ